MNSKIVIFLDSNNHPGWAVLDSDRHAVRQVLDGNPEDLAADAREREVIVLVPGEDVLLVSAEVPKMNRARLAQALPFALEEQLVGDIDSLHFATGAYQADGTLPVAVVAHEKMRHWLELLRSWSVKADVLMPVSLALPYEESAWHVMLAESASVRSGVYHGFACERENLNEYLRLAGPLPRQIHIHNYTSHACAGTLDDDIQCSEKLLPRSRMLADLASQAAQTQPLNLLQGQYAVKKSRLPHLHKMLQAAAVLAAVWVVLIFAWPAVSYFILKQRVSSIDSQIAVIYRRNFPQSASLVAPKLRMEEKLQKLSGQMGENRFLLLLGYMGKAMHAAPGVTLKRMDFQNSQLTLQLTAGSSDEFSAFTDYLTRQGLTVKQQNANLAGERVNATVTLE